MLRHYPKIRSIGKPIAQWVFSVDCFVSLSAVFIGMVFVKFLAIFIVYPIHEAGHYVALLARGYQVVSFGFDYVQSAPGSGAGTDVVVMAAGPLGVSLFGCLVTIPVWVSRDKIKSAWGSKIVGWEIDNKVFIKRVGIAALMGWIFFLVSDGIYNLIPSDNPHKDGSKIYASIKASR